MESQASCVYITKAGRNGRGVRGPVFYIIDKEALGESMKLCCRRLLMHTTVEKFSVSECWSMLTRIRSY